MDPLFNIASRDHESKMTKNELKFDLREVRKTNQTRFSSSEGKWSKLHETRVQHCHLVSSKQVVKTTFDKDDVIKKPGKNVCVLNRDQ